MRKKSIYVVMVPFFLFSGATVNISFSTKIFSYCYCYMPKGRNSLIVTLEDIIFKTFTFFFS